MQNKHQRWFLILSILCLLWPRAASAQPAKTSEPHPAIPRGPIPAGFGINIHFTEELPGEMEMLAATGVKWIRMDWGWGRTEKQKGVYDFSQPDKLVAAMEKHGLRAVFVLSYGNPLYSSVSPATDESRAAFARWAVAAVTHFKGRGILWEMWNEPNLFWRPEPNAQDYIKLALVAGAAIKQAAPDEAIIGPAMARIEMPLMEEYFKGGVLEFFDAVSVHPYRNTAPDTVAADYARLRALIKKYAPPGKSIPILSGEWGFSTGQNRLTEEQQARYLVRQWLVNVAEGVPLSIWYDWRDDGDNPKESEHRYGLVRRPHFAARTPAFDPKPSYLAAQTLIRHLDGHTFERRIDTGFADSWVLVFRNGKTGSRKFVAWSAVVAGRSAKIPFAGTFTTTDIFGKQLANRNSAQALPLSPAPIFLSPIFVKSKAQKTLSARQTKKQIAR